MRAITGTLEAPGAADNPTILSWRDEIARRYPEMAAYCANYTHDSIAWCGLTIAYCMAVNGIRPVFGRTDTDRFLWANAWQQFGRRLDAPQLGCVVVFTRAGGGHVALYEGEEGDNYVIRGGNQSDSVCVTRMAKTKFSGAFWPAQAAVTAPSGPPASSDVFKRYSNIVATQFGGAGDEQPVAYSDVKPGWPDRPGVALPFRFASPRPGVRVWKDGKSVDCPIVDVGPWYPSIRGPSDPYWTTGTRPRAEADDATNQAGIDLTPAAARAIGLNGKGYVSWDFIPTSLMPAAPSPTKPPVAGPVVIGTGAVGGAAALLYNGQFMAAAALVIAVVIGLVILFRSRS
jgi:uncharacterized protein (TIGR02594 family)